MQKKLFIVSADDDTDDQDLIAEALLKTRFDHLFNRVSDGQQLLFMLEALAASGNGLPDVIFLDLNMPVQDGRETIQILKSENSVFRDIPVVVLTTSGAGADKSFCIDKGANLFLVKPASFSLLISTLENAIVRITESGQDYNPGLN